MLTHVRKRGVISIILLISILFGLCSTEMTEKIIYAEELEEEAVIEKVISNTNLAEIVSEEKEMLESQEKSELQETQNILEEENLGLGEENEIFEQKLENQVILQGNGQEENVNFQETFSLPSKESEKWISIDVEKPGSSISIKIESEQEELDAPISLGILSPNSKINSDWYWEVGISSYSASAFSELKEVTCYFENAGRYRLMICNASHLNNLYFKEVNLTPFTVLGKMYEGDAYEINNNEEQATVLKSGERITCTLNGQGDVDYFVMEVTDVSIPLQMKITPGEGSKNGKLDSPICYSLFRGNENKEIITSTMGYYAAGAEDSAIEKSVTLKEKGIYYLKLANASYINPLYYGHYDNKTPFMVQCDYIGKEDLLELSEEIEDGITDLELFTKYPQYLSNKNVGIIENYINEHLNDAAKNVKGGIFGTAYKKALDSGGVNIMLNELLSSVGFAQNEYEKCRDEVAKEYILEICGKENYIKKIASGTSKKLKDLKDISGVLGEASLTREDINRLSNAFNVRPLYIKNLTDNIQKNWKSLSKDFKQVGKVIEYGEFLLEVLYIDAMEKDILEDLQSKIPMHYDLWWALDEYSRVYNEKVKKDIYYKLVKEPMNELISIIDEEMIESLFDMAMGKTPSPGVIQAAKLATKMLSRLIPAASVSDTVAAITRHSYTDSIKSGIINNMIREFITDSQRGVPEKETERKMKEYERYYELYLSLIGSDIDSIRKITDKNGLALLSFAEGMLSKYSYRAYINVCKRAIMEGQKTGLKYKKVGEYAIVSGRTEGLSEEQNNNLLIPSVVQEQEVRVIGEKAFENCKEINMLYIEEGTQIIKADAFKGCTNLKAVYFPKSLKVIETGAFSGCSKLENIEFQSDISTIGENAFENSGLKYVEGKSDYLKKYAEEEGVLYTEKLNKVIYLNILQEPEKLQYNVTDEKIDLSGLVLEVWYKDNTSEIIEDTSNVLAVFRNRFNPDSYIDLYYDDAESHYNIKIEQIETECEIQYVDQNSNQIDEPDTITAETGRDVSEINIDSFIKEIEGYKFVDVKYQGLNQVLNISNNVIKVIYTPNIFEVEFEANGGEGEVMPRQKFTYDILQELSENTYTYNGYVFDGWAITPDGAVVYKDKEEVENLVSADGEIKTLYAKWIPQSGNLENINTANKSEKIVKVSQIILTGISKKIAAGKKIKLSAKVIPFNAANKSLTWKSSNKKVATVNGKGVVTLKKKSGGKKVVITAMAKDGSGKEAIYEITSMKGVVKKVSISGSKIRRVKAGKVLKLKAKVIASDPNKVNRRLKWISSNTKYASVSSSGKVKTKKVGKGKKVKITAIATDGSGKKQSIIFKIR